ncbi:MAG: hypothetical protein AAF975_03365 [Spirochaetota bacterium]
MGLTDMYRLWYFFILFACVILQQLLFVPLSGYLFAEPLLPLIVLVILASATGSVLAEGLGFFTGFVWGFTQIDTGLPQGVFPLLLTIVAFVPGRLLFDRFKAPGTLLLAVAIAVAGLFWGLGIIALKLVFVNAYLPSVMEFVEILLGTLYSVLFCLGLSPLLCKFLSRWEWDGSV